MKVTHVVSSNINAIGWHRNTLYIRFNSGQSYQYDNVPHSAYQALTESESHGQHFHRFIKGTYKYLRLNYDPFAAKASSLFPIRNDPKLVGA